jgi:hypothetical protein
MKATPMNDRKLDVSEEAQRRKAALAQAAVEKAAYLHHARVSQKLLDANPDDAQEIVGAARRELDRLASQKTTNQECIAKWRTILDLPAAEIALAIVSDCEGQGTMLRLCSPFKAAPK